MNEGLQKVLLLVPVFLFSLCFHEYAHAWMALRLGDTTAQKAGRYTMHPLAHADLVGTLLLPIICIYNGWPFFGWAKPVPVDSRNFKNPRTDMAFVALAGPLSNILLAFVCTGLLWLLVRLPHSQLGTEVIPQFLATSIMVNLMLAFFNLIPIPPLDGFSVLQGLVPKKAAHGLDILHRYGNALLLLLLVSGLFNLITYPVRFAYHSLLYLVTLGQIT